MESLTALQQMEKHLAPYRQLVQQVDTLCAAIEQDWAAQIVCQAGCSDCCRLQSVFPVEAANLYLGWRQLPAVEAQQVRDALAAATDDACPLLTDARCPLYAVRPLICRTHGLPILFQTDAGRSIDTCPLNFRGVDTLPGSAVIDLDRLNTVLVGLNHDFVRQVFLQAPPPERIQLAEVFDFPWPFTAP